jgi:hypothetical protein
MRASSVLPFFPSSRSSNAVCRRCISVIRQHT